MNRSRILLFVCVVFEVGFLYAQPKINGLSFVSSGDKATAVHVTQFKGVQANWAALMPFAMMRSTASPELNYNPDRQWYGETEAGIQQYYETLSQGGIQIMLKPQIWIRKGAFTGHIKMSTVADWVLFEKQYLSFILRFARLAQQLNIPLFCIGTELKAFVRARPAFWKGLIEEIRGVYKGKLTYAANWDEYQETFFWDALDFVGIDAYFPLSEERDPSYETLVQAWQPHFKKIQGLALSCDKKVLFTEFGYRSVDYLGAKPWLVDKNKEAVNLRAQSRAIQAIIDTFWSQHWFQGGFIWKWFMYLEGVGGPENNRFTPQNKPAEKTLRSLYSEYSN